MTFDMGEQFQRDIRGVFERRLPASECIPMGGFTPEDIFIVGYPKSGNTWMQNLVGGIMYGVESLEDNAEVYDLVPDVHDCQFYRRQSRAMFFKSHSLPTPEYRRVVYLVRDGRDAMVSYFHYRSALNGAPLDFLKFVEGEGDLYPSKWSDHVSAWMSNPFQADILTIRYENLRENPLRELRNICKFAGIRREDKFLQNVVDSACFEKMRIRERKYGWTRQHLKWPKNRSFVRRGEVGSFIDEMPPAVLHAFLKQSRDTLKKCGYLQW